MKKVIRLISAVVFIVVSISIYKISNNEEVLSIEKAAGAKIFPSEISSTMNYLFDVLEKNKNPQESNDLDSDTGDFVKVTIQRVVDGDTFELSTGEKVRIIGVNTPESTTTTELYGKEASNYTKEKLGGSKSIRRNTIPPSTWCGTKLIKTFCPL